ncbi:12836_t:CDS:2 [Funneliformis geosporum]|uniref:12836_t:CDS:1 n=1 Tax=Funneliformis geosporum TaxID=1117311 RepID=A0A9W4STI7_9GLOM|nr:12836_t:CDS:2 [Funneliformis geosporum]
MDEVEQLKKEAEENNSLNSKLKEELKENMSRIKDLETELEEADGIIDKQRDLVFNFTKSLVIKEREFDKLSESYDEEHEKLRKETKKNTVKDEKIKELE